MPENPTVTEWTEAEPQGTRLSVKRNNTTVIVAVDCGNEYAAIELYDRVCQSAQSGHLTLELKAR